MKTTFRAPNSVLMMTTVCAVFFHADADTYD